VKHLAGGLVDIEFIVQYLMLRHAPARPDLLTPNTDAALLAFAHAGILADERAGPLRSALKLWRNLHGFLRITVGSKLDEATLSPSIASRLAQIGGDIDFDSLKQHMIETAADVRRRYRDIVESEEEKTP
jgi:glutamate-ammonia-ligase adenylyltransferase